MRAPAVNALELEAPCACDGGKRSRGRGTDPKARAPVREPVPPAPPAAARNAEGGAKRGER